MFKKIFINVFCCILLVFDTNVVTAEGIEKHAYISDLIKHGFYEKAHEELRSWPVDTPERFYFLGYLTANGFGVKEDFNTAHSFLSRAFEMGLLESGFAICQLIFANPKSSKYDIKSTINCYEKNSDLGHKISKEILAVLILRSEHRFLNVKYSLHDAKRLLEEAYDLGNGSGSSAFLLTQLHSTNKVETSEYLALLEAAANNTWISHYYDGDNFQNEVAMTVALNYLKGENVEKDLKKYFKFLSIAGRKGDVKAVCLMGEALLIGVGVDKNLSKAKAYLDYANENGCSKANQLLKRLNWEVQLDQAYKEFEYSPPELKNFEVASANKNNFGLLDILMLGLMVAAAANSGGEELIEGFANEENKSSSRPLNDKQYSTPNNSTLSGCSSDFSCGTGKACIKKPGYATGVCMTTLDSYGVKTYQKPSTSSILPNNRTRECRYNTDCPIGFRCDVSYRACVK